jgi:hypothetical protein
MARWWSTCGYRATSSAFRTAASISVWMPEAFYN